MSRCVSEPSTRAELGRRAEEAVAEWLAARGVEVLAANVRVGRLEIDLVCRDGEVIVIVEVRTRGATSWQRALGSIDERKRQRLRRAGNALWQMRYSREPGTERMRFDAASVRFETNGAVVIEYVKAAF